MNLDVKDYAELIKAVASLLWPVLAFVAVFIFREQIRQLLVQLGKMNKGKFLGVELEITDKLNRTLQARFCVPIFGRMANMMIAADGFSISY